jgi:DNA-binding transcriptional ArsR family regulator
MDMKPKASLDAPASTGRTRQISDKVKQSRIANIETLIAEVKRKNPNWRNDPKKSARIAKLEGNIQKLTGNDTGNRSRTLSEVSLANLIAAGILSPPVKLFRRYKGTRLEATLLGDGSVEFKGQRFQTCSGAAEAARETVSGGRMNTNGWVFWQYKTPDGKRLLLRDARRQVVTQVRKETTSQEHSQDFASLRHLAGKPDSGYRQQLKALGIDTVKARVLRVLHQTQGGLSVSEIATRAEITVPTVYTGLNDYPPKQGLLSQGLVTKGSREDNQRGPALYTLTDAGRQVAEKIKDVALPPPKAGPGGTP